jgi:ABC-type nitrate/sulfonate/bicarbonate transport system permease component
LSSQSGKKAGAPRAWRSSWWANNLPVILGILLFIGVWQAYVTIFNVSTFLLPGPADVGRVAVEIAPTLPGHIGTTLYEIFVGYVFGNLFAIAIAFVIINSAFAERMIYPFLVMSQTIPKIAIAPLLVIWFGTGLVPKVIIIALLCFFPTAVNAVQGLKSVDPNAMDLVRLVDNSKWVAFRKVQLPNSLPYLFAGLKISMASAVIGAIIAEWVGAQKGLGYLILYGAQSLRTDLLFLGVTGAMLLGISLYAVVAVAEKLFSWKDAEIKASSGVE